MLKSIIFGMLLLFSFVVNAQENTAYTQRVLENTEIDILFSYYDQDGNNAAVTGGEGTEKLTDAASSIVVRLPLNNDDIITIDTGISAYSSASSSNVNPLDGNANKEVSPFNASSGASQSDELIHFKGSYEHSSKDRNSRIGANIYAAREFDYFSLGFGANYAYLFNEKNTEVSVSGQVFLDTWKAEYPIELRDGFFDNRVTGSGTYSPLFNEFSNLNRNSYSLSLSVSQILGSKVQGSLFVDVIQQNGLLSTPFQRMYFGDRDNFFIDDFQLADAVERLPDSRFKFPVGGRLNYYVNEVFVLRSYYRFYTDNWGVTSHTASVEIPIKLNDVFTVYPSYRFYNQTKADYFYKKESAVSSLAYYTSDYDLSNFNAHQYGAGLRYKDIFAKLSVLGFGLKTLDVKGIIYNRSTGLDSFIVSLGTTFVYTK
ncbi:DUF3570 domain-containing protein [Cellulophaga sp. F20128]|uniref:DUF3570 domain-containing protein n=1 Tax=Cellulophaga sp. F20128 TaxID=2926413 RepID=UPI001FF2EDE8|nr:DUF3570 domain-containing protein [Cellulophaga sp. F20128]MCK0158529.1 DUF3570 domain-containing protein [Cellulophaga sp. F20128]